MYRPGAEMAPSGEIAGYPLKLQCENIMKQQIEQNRTRYFPEIRNDFIHNAKNC